MPVLVLLAIPWMTIAAAETRLQGQIQQDQVWLEDKSPYRLTGALTISRGTTVTIPPGVVVRFDKGSHLTVKGALIAGETLFDGMEDLYNREMLLFQPGSRGRLTYCVIQNLELQIRTSDVIAANNMISNPNGSGITIGKASRPTITGNDFRRNSYYAVYNEGKTAIRVPNNFWGASDGPSGAGPGQGDAVNPSVDFMPFQKADIGEHLVLSDRRLDRAALRPGSRFSLTYVIDNLNSYDHAVILGASIYTDPDKHIHSPTHDRKISIKPGRHRFTRSFTVPDNAPEGPYDVLWGVMKADLTAYYVLKKDLGALRIGTVSAPDAATTPVAAPAKAPGWVPLKQMPF
jgi:parallel beta-helix repeat protein